MDTHLNLYLKRNRYNLRATKPGFIPFLVLSSSLFLFSFFFGGDAIGQSKYNRLCLEAVEFEKVGNLDGAVGKYSEAIALDPDEWSGYNYRANVNLKRGREDEVIADVTKAISLSPQTLSLYTTRANCLFTRGKYDEAIADYTVALSRPVYSDKGLYRIYLQRGESYYFTKKFTEAVRDFNLSIGLAENFEVPAADIYGFRGRSHLELGHYPEAIKDFEMVLLANPNDPQAVFLQGYSYFKTGETDKANAIARKILESDPPKKIIFPGSRILEMYTIDLRRSKTKKLLDDAQTVMLKQMSAPITPASELALSGAYANLDTAWNYSPDFSSDDQALKDTILARLFTLYPLLNAKPPVPGYTSDLENQAKNAEIQKKTDQAINLWSKALSLTPCIPSAYYSRAMLYDNTGDFTSAISDMKKYLQLVPAEPGTVDAKNKIHEWEGLLKMAPIAQQENTPAAINEIPAYKDSAANYHFALSLGGSFGMQTGKNPSLASLWSQVNQAVTGLDYQYPDKTRMLYGGDLEMIVRPIKRLGIGGFGKLTGGIGARTSVSGTKYIMNMMSAQYGGLLRGYVILGKNSNPDLFLQYSYGKSNLSGYNAVATMTGAVFNYSYMNDYRSSAPFNSFGIGVGGKSGKHGYMTISLDYIKSTFEKISYEVKMNLANTSDVGSTGTLKNDSTGDTITATYNGLLLKIMMGVCF